MWVESLDASGSNGDDDTGGWDDSSCEMAPAAEGSVFCSAPGPASALMLARGSICQRSSPSTHTRSDCPRNAARRRCWRASDRLKKAIAVWLSGGGREASPGGMGRSGSRLGILDPGLVPGARDAEAHSRACRSLWGVVKHGHGFDIARYYSTISYEAGSFFNTHLPVSHRVMPITRSPCSPGGRVTRLRMIG